MNDDINAGALRSPLRATLLFFVAYAAAMLLLHPVRHAIFSSAVFLTASSGIIISWLIAKALSADQTTTGSERGVTIFTGLTQVMVCAIVSQFIGLVCSFLIDGRAFAAIGDLTADRMLDLALVLLAWPFFSFVWLAAAIAFGVVVLAREIHKPA